MNKNKKQDKFVPLKPNFKKMDKAARKRAESLRKGGFHKEVIRIVNEQEGYRL